MNLLKSSTFLGNFCKGVKIYHFRATFIDIWQFFSGHTGVHSYTTSLKQESALVNVTVLRSQREREREREDDTWFSDKWCCMLEQCDQIWRNFTILANSQKSFGNFLGLI